VLDTSCVHSRDTVEQVLALCRPDVTTREVSRLTGVPESTIAHWRRGDRRAPRAEPRPSAACPRCNGHQLGGSYAYLLGAYLGDGHITTSQRTACLWIYCADAWPGIQQAVRQAITAVMPSTSVSVVQRTGCVAVKSFTKHWTCLFPQHGPGMKHTRRIVLEPWQEELVAEHTGPFLRGLFHSDGCRMTNWARRTTAGEVRRYEYPRWFFTNKSTDILGLCSTSLDRLGIAHRFPRPDTISVARRKAVAMLDAVVGPKA
jgi:hypothetical protein